MNRPTITAHSGCEGTADGSMAAILCGITLKADLIEVDVRHMPGLGLALTHDVTSDITGLVTLEEAFRQVAAHPPTGINCDLKEYGLAAQVLALADDCGLSDGQLAFSGSLTAGQLTADPTIVRRAKVYLNVEEVLCELYREKHPWVPADVRPWDVVRSMAQDGLDRWIEPVIEAVLGAGVLALNLPPRHFLLPHLQRLGEAGIRLSAWTINEPEEMRQLMALPWLENLTTRRVALALEARAAMENDATERGKALWA